MLVIQLINKILNNLSFVQCNKVFICFLECYNLHSSYLVYLLAVVFVYFNWFNLSSVLPVVTLKSSNLTAPEKVIYLPQFSYHK